MYLTFEEYENLHDGMTFDDMFEDSTFYLLEKEAESKINLRTYNRLKNETKVPEEVKLCVSALIDYLYTKRKLLEVNSDFTAGTVGIASQSNDGVSISYRTLSADSLLNSVNKDSDKIIENYLYGVRNSNDRLVLYKGIYSDE